MGDKGENKILATFMGTLSPALDKKNKLPTVPTATKKSLLTPRRVNGGKRNKGRGVFFLLPPPPPKPLTDIPQKRRIRK